jgi:hypothetical protein
MADARFRIVKGRAFGSPFRNTEDIPSRESKSMPPVAFYSAPDKGERDD